ncbi:MAG: hypothetical protein IKQ51_10020 [Bacteroidaceae bacterium]|nr:hypothetical protein [Bacteroidaceae bacterium]
MSLEEKKELLQSMAEVLKGSKIEQMIMFAEEGSKIVYKEVEPEPKLEETTTEPKQEEVKADIIGKALKKCASFVWGNAAYAVAFCVCRDMCGWQDNASYFERQMQQQGIDFPSGTINTTISRNPFMKLNVDKWDGSNVMERVIKLRDEFQQQVGLAELCKKKA